MSRFDRFLKRFFDVFFSIIGLVFLFPLIVFAWIISTIETKSNGFFIQKRVGVNGNLFHVIKIKTMREVDGINTTITASNDIRITKSGVFFRRAKIDELPQLWNVLVGQMSFVGPRPDVPGYADQLIGDDRIILSIRPGITGPASLKYKEEEKLLSAQENARKYNDEIIWPDKVRINREYIENYSIMRDFYYLWKTLIG